MKPKRKKRFQFFSKKDLKTLDKYVLGAALYIFLWSLAFFIAWLILKQEPGILEGCILAPGVVEIICAAWIKQGKTKIDTINSDESTTDDSTVG